MSLHYRVYWIDDNIEDAIDAGIKSEFEEYLGSLGFKPEIECFETGNTALASIKAQGGKIDLILSDYNIAEEGAQGDELIRDIRSGKVYSEVLFYSAQSNFEDIAKTLYQDRVSFLSLQGDSGFRLFKQKVYWLIDLTIEKLQEINNIRGLVMAETSSMDKLIIEILGNYFDSEDKDRDALKKYVVDLIAESATKDSEAAAAMGEAEIAMILQSRLFNADKKARAINKLLKLKGLISKYPRFHEKYGAEVRDKRNDLAHAKSETIDGIDYLILSRKDGEHSLKWDQEYCIEIRKNLKEFERNLHLIREDLIALN